MQYLERFNSTCILKIAVMEDHMERKAADNAKRCTFFVTFLRARI